VDKVEATGRREADEPASELVKDPDQAIKNNGRIE